MSLTWTVTWTWDRFYQTDCILQEDAAENLIFPNVFVGEQNGQGKPGAGVKVDRATPLVHLRESQQALDAVLAFKL